MKIHISINLPAVTRALELIAKSAGHEIVPVQEAELVIADEPGAMLAHLKAGKRVVQFITQPSTQSPVEGLRTAPDFADRFRVYQVVSWHKDVPVAEEFIEYLKVLATTEVTP